MNPTKYAKCLRFRRLKPDLSRIRQAKLFIVYAFGKDANREMALIVEAVYEAENRSPNSPRLCYALQFEVADNLLAPRVVIPADRLLVVREHRKINPRTGKPAYLDTYEVLMQTVERFPPARYREVIVMAHPDHLFRCVEMTKKAGYDVVGTPDVSYVPYTASDWPKFKGGIGDRAFQLLGWFASHNRFTFYLREAFFVRPQAIHRGII